MKTPIAESDRVIPVRGETYLEIFTYRYPKLNGAPDVWHQRLQVIGWVRGSGGTMQAVTCRGIEPFPEPDDEVWRGAFLSTRSATTRYHHSRAAPVHDVPSFAASQDARWWDSQRRSLVAA